MNIQQPTPMTPLRARMIADMTGRNLGPASQSSHLRACKRFADWLVRSPEATTAEPEFDGLTAVSETIQCDESRWHEVAFARKRV